MKNQTACRILKYPSTKTGLHWKVLHIFLQGFEDLTGAVGCIWLSIEPGTPLDPLPQQGSHLLKGCFWQPRQIGGHPQPSSKTLTELVRCDQMNQHRPDPVASTCCNVTKAQCKAGGTQIQCCQRIEASWRFWLQIRQLFSMNHLHCNWNFTCPVKDLSSQALQYVAKK